MNQRGAKRYLSIPGIVDKNSVKHHSQRQEIILQLSDNGRHHGC